MMNQRDAQFFRPLWRRVLVTVVVGAWFAFELIVSHDVFWMSLSGIGLAYALWNFFLRFPAEPETDENTGPDPKS